MRVPSPCLYGGIGVVDDQGLLPSQASMQENVLSIPSFQKIKTDADVRIEEPFAVKRTLTAPLDSAENDCFHRTRIFDILDQSDRFSKSWRKPSPPGRR